MRVEKQPHTVGEGLELAGLDQRYHLLVLSLGVLVDQCRRVGHGEVLERRECAVVAWLAGDYLLVNLGREEVRRPNALSLWIPLQRVSMSSRSVSR
jgi:hypothetical protein